MVGASGHTLLWKHYSRNNNTMVCTRERLREFEMPKEWVEYQFSDCFNARGRYNHSSWRTQFLWNNTLYGEYHINAVKSGLKWSDYDYLLHIIKARAKGTRRPPADATVVHLRIGDVMGRDYQSVFDLLHHKNLFYPGMHWADYVKPLNFYASIPYAKNVVLMGGFHHITNGIEEIKSCQYVAILKRFFEARGSTVYLRLGKNPDKDIVYATRSRVFVQSGGGFSRTISQLVKRSGGKVIDRIRRPRLRPRTKSQRKKSM